MSDPVMATALQFTNEALVKDLLARQLRHGRLALLIGSGISRPFGLPSWEDLVDRIFSKKNDSRPAGFDLTMAAELAEKRHYPGNRAAFESAVHQALYLDAKLSFRDLRRSDVLCAIGALVISSRRGSAAVINYNFDDVLEQYLAFHGFDIQSVYIDRHWSGLADVTVYHPHGFLPANSKKERDGSIVITREDYNRVVGKDGDLWRQLLKTLLRTRMCLFLGLGVRDAAVDSLVAEVHRDHASNGNPPYWGFTFTTEENPVDEPLWIARGIHVLRVPDYFEGLASYLCEICQRAATIS